ncbi:hypothetical protein QTO17_11095 [Vibrio owensii]
MQELQNLITQIAQHVRANGTQTNQAKSAYGADVYVLGDVTASLTDDGASWIVQTDGLRVGQTMTHPPMFIDGSEKQLRELGERLLGKEVIEATKCLEFGVTEFGGTDEVHPDSAVVAMTTQQAINIADALLSVKGSSTFESINLKADIPQYFDDEGKRYQHEMLNAFFVIDNKGAVWVSARFKEMMEEIDAQLPVERILELVAKADDIELTTSLLIERYANLNSTSGWPEHPEYYHEDWQSEAGQGNTQLGYWDWVTNQLLGNH